ncbi:MAG: hypothetical protein J1F42_08485 [Lachnospiraceae bacterium]|nr:hypothetical protein [Lachnospiraceae bacterium]
MLKVLLIVLIVFACLFLLSLVVYFFNLDMKLAAAMIPVMNKIYDRGKAKREKKAGKMRKEPKQTGRNRYETIR